MCIICVHYEKEKMSTQEATRALGEMRAAMDPEHVEEVEKMLLENAEPEEEVFGDYSGLIDYLNSDYFGSD